MKYLVIVLLLAFAFAQPPQEQVDMIIPGYTQHKWYSGMLDIGHALFHYVYFDSQRDPNNDPLVLWLNGGPGCSSLIGMVYENGPFLFKQGTANFEINPNAWNKKANLLYISSPGGVGFSFNKDGNVKHNDSSVAEDNYMALSVFFMKKFPNLKKNDFYITGESYSGIYIPYLADLINKKNKLPERELTIRLKGIMIGNACTDPRQCAEPGNDLNLGIYQYQNLFVHGYYTERLWDNIKAACMLGYHSQGCANIRATADKLFYQTNTSMLNLYAPCLYQKAPQAEGKKHVRLFHGRLVPTMEDGVICEDMYGISHWFNEATIQAKLHVPFRKYEACSDNVATNYTMFSNASYWLYPGLIKSGLRIWIFEGDVDNSVPITGTVTWLTRLRDNEGIPIMEQWREWWVPGLHKHEDQVGGMVWKLKGLTFASVKGAGHMVPKDKGKEAYVLFDSFLQGIDLPDNPNI